VLIFKVGRLASQRTLERFAYDEPSRCLALAEILLYRLWMLATANGPVTLIVDLGVPRPPGDRNGEIGSKAKPDGGP
jgi:hypothetical protein